MSIVLDSTTRVLIQGITGKEGSFWTKHMVDYGTNVVAGVTPGREGQVVNEVPVFHTVRRATAEFPADASLLFVAILQFAPKCVSLYMIVSFRKIVG